METLESHAPSDVTPAGRGRKHLPAGLFTNLALAVALAIFIMGAVVPLLTGGTVMTVMTGSMTPNLPPGHLIVYHPVDVNSLKAGDVIAYQPENNITGGVPITHRVIDVRSAGGHATEVIVQGDANPVPDAPVKARQIIGKMSYYIPFVGILHVLAFCAGLPWLPDALTIVFLLYGASLFLRDMIPRGIKSARNEAATA